MTSVPEQPDDETGATGSGNADAYYGDDQEPSLRYVGRAHIPQTEWVRQRAAWNALWRMLLAAPPHRAEPPAPQMKRTRRPSPSRLAKWEAAWQAERDAEAES